jgi:hypothetical protein
MSHRRVLGVSSSPYCKMMGGASSRIILPVAFLFVLLLLVAWQWHRLILVPNKTDTPRHHDTPLVASNEHHSTTTTTTTSSVVGATPPRRPASAEESLLHHHHQPPLDLPALLAAGRVLPTRDHLPPSHPSFCANHNNESSVRRGIYHIQMGDIGGAAGTIFYQFVIGQIMYAESHQLIPWVHFSNVSHVIYDPIVHGGGGGGDQAATGITLSALTGRNATYVKGHHRRDYTPGPPNASLPVRQETLFFPGTGVWEHYFFPLVADFIPGDDMSCADPPLLYVTMDLYLITPGLHSYSPVSPKCWRYQSLPDYISRPHLSVTEWLAPQRRTAHDIVRRYIRPRAYLHDAAQTVNPHCRRIHSSSNNDNDHPCLGLHIRHSDKASGRRVIDTDEFLPFVQAFLAATTAGIGGTIYLATDSSQVLSHIEHTWPVAVTSRIRTAGHQILRSSTDTAVFDLHVDDNNAGGGHHHHRTNVEVMIEILALSQCQFLLHGFSAVSEAAIWTNLELHDTSINLEDAEHLSVELFQKLVGMVVRNESKQYWPHPVGIIDIWPQLYDRSTRETITETTTTTKETTTTVKKNKNEINEPPTDGACIGFDGVLLISKVGRRRDDATATTTAGRAFFSSVLNQLAFAGRNNLLPWVHLDANDRANFLLFDEREHGAMPKKHVQMMLMMNASIVFRPAVGNSTTGGHNYPTGFPVPPVSTTTAKPISPRTLHGNGIWESYFLPVSDFVPGDSSCQAKPLVELDEAAIDSGFGQEDDWVAVRAPGNLQPPALDIQTHWRTRGAEIVRKYYKLQPYILNRADQVNHPLEWDQPCLGVHLRNGDKPGKDRRKVSPTAFVPYIEEFAKSGGKRIYVASDSHRAIQFLTNNLPGHLAELIHTQGVHVVRSTKLDWPLHMIDDHHRVNAELLVDILAMSRCAALLHSTSTTSEAALYLNPDLIHQSVNLEDENPISAKAFGDMLRTKVFHSKR